MKFLRLGWLLLFALIFSHAQPFAAYDIPLLQSHIASIKTIHSQQDFLKIQPTHLSKEKYQSYFFNKLNTQKDAHFFYKYNVGQYTIVSQFFLSNTDDETVLLSHGYLDHSGFNQSLVNVLLANQYNVILYDQPGHGLSSGNRSSIDSFNTYQQVLNQTVKHYQPYLHNTIHVIGHSTGNVGIIDALSKNNKAWTGQTIMLAPLIRSKLWGTSKFFNYKGLFF